MIYLFEAREYGRQIATLLFGLQQLSDTFREFFRITHFRVWSWRSRWSALSVQYNLYLSNHTLYRREIPLHGVSTARTPSRLLFSSRRTFRKKTLGETQRVSLLERASRYNVPDIRTCLLGTYSCLSSERNR